MIVATQHNSQKGTHSAPALLEWLRGVSWRPLTLDAFANDIRHASDVGHVLLPEPHQAWVRGQDRMAPMTLRRVGRGDDHFAERLRAAGWELVSLFCLAETVEKIGTHLGFRCRCCLAVSGRAAMDECPTKWTPSAHALCGVCAQVGNAVLRGKAASRDALLQMPSLVQDARSAAAALSRLPRRRTNEPTRQSIASVCRALGLQQPRFGA